MFEVCYSKVKNRYKIITFILSLWFKLYVCVFIDNLFWDPMKQFGSIISFINFSRKSYLKKTGINFSVFLVTFQFPWREFPRVPTLTPCIIIDCFLNWAWKVKFSRNILFKTFMIKVIFELWINKYIHII